LAVDPGEQLGLVAVEARAVAGGEHGSGGGHVAILPSEPPAGVPCAVPSAGVGGGHEERQMTEVRTHRARRAVAALIVVAASAVVPVALAQPSFANASITATGVALNDEAGCTKAGGADLDLGFTSHTVETETGLITNGSGDTLGQFSQSSGL